MNKKNEKEEEEKEEENDQFQSASLERPMPNFLLLLTSRPQY